jgi:hypothetical protein
LEFSFAGQKLVWTFLLAKVDFAILGADFLKHFYQVGRHGRKPAAGPQDIAQICSQATCSD